MDKEIKAKVIANAKEFLKDHEIPWHLYDEGEFEGEEQYHGCATWKHLKTGAKIEIVDIYWDDKTGEVLQAGAFCGVLRF